MLFEMFHTRNPVLVLWHDHADPAMARTTLLFLQLLEIINLVLISELCRFLCKLLNRVAGILEFASICLGL